MQELIDRFMETGLTTEQAQSTLQTVSQWLQENYPVAGALVTTWIRNQSSDRSS